MTHIDIDAHTQMIGFGEHVGKSLRDYPGLIHVQLTAGKESITEQLVKTNDGHVQLRLESAEFISVLSQLNHDILGKVWPLDLTYRVSPPKAERSIFITLIFENKAYFDFIRYDSIFRQEWYRDPWNWLSSFDVMIIFHNIVIVNFLFILVTF